MRQKKKRAWLSDLCLLLAVICLFLAAREYYPYLKNDIELRKLREEVAEETEDEEDGEAIDWDRLKKINPDIIAWIRVPGTKIDYPVLQCSEWNEYLHKNYKGEESYPGSIFIQPECPADFSGSHSILYGHNMRNLSMFGSLHQFEKEAFYRKNNKVYLYQPDQTIIGTVYSTYDCRDTGRTYETAFDSGEKWKDWLLMSRENSYYDTGKVPEKADRVVTLSTCSNGRSRDSRYVVHCIAVREG